VTDSGPPKAVIARLSLYLRQLRTEVSEGRTTVSSSRLGKLLGLTDSQVRKDLAWFGQFGYRGIGYRCEELIGRIRDILGAGRTRGVALVGCGHLGQALLGYGGFAREGFEIQLAFDRDPTLVGRTIRGIAIRDFAEFAALVQRAGIELAILAVPSDQAHETAAMLARSGITGILNFAPIRLNLDPSVSVSHVDLAIELEQLAFAVVREHSAR
jgi:redox-sensing transcriptional repressor